MWKTNVIVGFRKTELAREAVREKRVLSPLRVIIILFPFQYSVTGQCGGKKIPSVGRAFYDSHGVFRSLYPFLTTLLHRYNPTLNPCIMRTLKINTIKKKHNVRCKIKFPNTSGYATLLYAFPCTIIHGIIFLHHCWATSSHELTKTSSFTRATLRSTTFSTGHRPTSCFLNIGTLNYGLTHVKMMIWPVKNISYLY